MDLYVNEMVGESGRWKVPSSERFVHIPPNGVSAGKPSSTQVSAVYGSLDMFPGFQEGMLSLKVDMRRKDPRFNEVVERLELQKLMGKIKAFRSEFVFKADSMKGKKVLFIKGLSTIAFP